MGQIFIHIENCLVAVNDSPKQLIRDYKPMSMKYFINYGG